MKKVVFIAICTVGFLGLTSCGSTAPCGLSQTKENHIDYHQAEVIVAETTIVE